MFAAWHCPEADAECSGVGCCHQQPHCCTLCILAIISQLFLLPAVRKSGRSSVIIFLLAVLISVGAASLIINQVVQIVQDIR